MTESGKPESELPGAGEVGGEGGEGGGWAEGGLEEESGGPDGTVSLLSRTTSCDIISRS